MKQNYLPLIRRLTTLLVISGAINIGLAAFLIYWMIKERPPTPYCEHRPMEFTQNPAALSASVRLLDTWNAYNTLPIEQLIVKLNSSESIDSRFNQRDLALACLVACHNFDISKAMQSRELPNRQKVIVQKKDLIDGQAELLIFPGLSDADYESIIQFARTEQWPLTPYGLFDKLLSGKPPKSLEEAFFHTPHFMAVEMLFGRIGNAATRSELLQIIQQGNWELLSTHYAEQRALLDLSGARRQKFLLSYIDLGSSAAAYMLLKTEGKDSILKLDSKTIVKILELLNERTPAAIDLAMTIIKTSKNLELLKAANDRLNRSNKKIAIHMPAPVISRTYYVVKEGDSLWKIAKTYGVRTNKLAEINHLDESAFIQPGMQLVIP